jgi:hypothetical protein
MQINFQIKILENKVIHILSPGIHLSQHFAVILICVKLFKHFFNYTFVLYLAYLYVN